METKKVKVPFLKKEEAKEMYHHFGYILKDEIVAETETVLILERDRKYPLMKKVIKLEKLYWKTKKKVPSLSIITLLIAVALILIGFFVPHPIAKLVLYIVGATLLFYGSFELISFLILLANKKKTQEAIFKKCDEYLFQNLPELPLKDAIVAKTEATEDIKKNVRLTKKN
ncbi:MAG: hypothetical protein RBR85_00860 [Bacilli bacterium]|jgi:hypothetical protein|nr:hypothetical protein [Bacilli bacterium]